jgi:hypothetical protein
LRVKHRKRRRRCLDLRVRDGPLFSGGAGYGGGMIGLGLGDIGACGRHIVLGLVERLPRRGLAD